MRRLVVGVFVVLVVTGGAAAFVLGVGPVDDVVSEVQDAAASGDGSAGASSAGSAGGGGSGENGGTDDGTNAGGGSSDGGADSSAGESADASSPFTFAIDRIEKCGQTCRDVTATLHNNQETAASDVVVTTRISADGDQLWTGEADLGTVAAGGSKTSTKRVKLSYMDGYKIKQNDGYVTIETTVDTADGSFTFSERRKVA